MKPGHLKITETVTVIRKNIKDIEKKEEKHVTDKNKTAD